MKIGDFEFRRDGFLNLCENFKDWRSILEEIERIEKEEWDKYFEKLKKFEF